MPTDPIFLRDISCFHDFPDEKLIQVAQIANAVCYLPGYTLFKEGDPGKYIFFIVKGEVEVCYNIGEAGQVRVDTISGEEIAGCSALIEPYRYTATERSLTEIEVLEIDSIALREIMQQDCQLGMKIQYNIIKVLQNRILDLRLGLSPT